MRTVRSAVLVLLIAGVTAATASAQRTAGAGRGGATAGGQGRGRAGAAGAARGRAGASGAARGRSAGAGVNATRVVNAREALQGIELTAEERASVRTITERYQGQIRALQGTARGGGGSAAGGGRGTGAAGGRGGATGQGGARQQQSSLAALAERERADIRAVLTPQHRQQFDSNILSLQGRGRRGG